MSIYCFLPPSPSAELFKLANRGVPAPSKPVFLFVVGASPKVDFEARSAKVRLFPTLNIRFSVVFWDVMLSVIFWGAFFSSSRELCGLVLVFSDEIPKRNKLIIC